MGRYRNIDTRIWSDAKFRDISDHGKFVFLFVLTHPHMTSVGAMRATIPGMAAELGWTTKAFRDAFEEASSKGLLEHDEKASFVGVPNFIRYNPPQSANAVKSWGKFWGEIPECELQMTLYKRLKAFLDAFHHTFAEAFASTITQVDARPSLIQEQEQEQEQDIKSPTPFCQFPKELDTTDFRDTWTDWRKHRREIKHPLTPSQEAKKLEQLARWGPTRAVAAINWSISNGWQGIFEEKQDDKRRSAIGPGQRHDPEAAKRDPSIGTF
jgi:hypothetical protein